MAAAASVALVIVATTGCSQTDHQSEPADITVDQPEEPATGSGATGTEPDPESAEEVTGGEPEPAGDGGPEGTGAEDPEIGRSDGEAASSAAAAPEQFSTGPVLEWTEIDPGFDDLFELKPVGDGRVLARAWTDGEGPGLFGQRIVVSANGTDWAEVPMPDGIFPGHVNISADRWVVTGQSLDSGWLAEAVDRVFFSDDQGSTWTEMALELPSSSTSPYAVEWGRVSSVLVSGEQVVLAVSGLTTINGQTLLEDVGRLPAGKTVVLAAPIPDGVSFTLIDSDVENPYGSVTSAAWSLAAIYSQLGEEALPELNFEELVLTYDEVDFTEAERFDLFSPGSGPLTRILAGDATATEVVTGFEGVVLSGAATDEGFIVTAIDDSGERILSSRDGLVWSEAPSVDSGSSGGTIAADGTIWRVAFEAGGSLDIQRAQVGYVPATVATFDGLQYPGPLALGPAGFVLVAQRDLSRSLRTDQGLPAEGRVARDGYELRYDEAERSLALWDLATDTAIYEFGPEEMQGDTPPDGVRMVADGRGAGIVFEDPETGADLVAFTTDDMAFLVGMAAAEQEAASSGVPAEPELWVGWSADGRSWGWQSLADAFGIHDTSIWPEFAVGHDFVITRVATFQPPDPADPGDDGHFLPKRWFLARAP